MQDSGGDFEKCVFLDLEQLVPGIGFENIQQRLAVVAVARISGLIDDVLKAATQQRDIARRKIVGDRRKQADEQLMPDHFTFLVDLLDADGVHMHGAMHDGSLIGLGHAQQVATAEELGNLGRQGVLCLE